LTLSALVLPCWLAGCGYHAAGHSSRLPANVQVLAVPVFINQTQAYRIEQLLTREVVREFNDRTRYHVVSSTGGDADATLQSTVLSAQAAPLTYDALSGRISSAVVMVSVKVS